MKYEVFFPMLQLETELELEMDLERSFQEHSEVDLGLESKRDDDQNSIAKAAELEIAEFQSIAGQRYSAIPFPYSEHASSQQLRWQAYHPVLKLAMVLSARLPEQKRCTQGFVVVEVELQVLVLPVLIQQEELPIEELEQHYGHLPMNQPC